MSLRQNIRRELDRVCTADLLGAFTPRRVSGRRESWSRLQSILAILRAGETFNANTLAKRTGFVAKTIHRDIDYLRREGVKIVFDSRKNTFVLDVTAPLPPQFTHHPGGTK
jgi:hypothetical protein